MVVFMDPGKMIMSVLAFVIGATAIASVVPSVLVQLSNASLVQGASDVVVTLWPLGALIAMGGVFVLIYNLITKGKMR